MFPFRLFNYFVDRLCVVIGAFAGSQVPAFMQQYTQRLIGRVDELNLLMKNLQQLAFFSNKSLSAYIEKFLSNADPDFVQQGLFMQEIVTRWQHLNQALNHLQTATIWQRPFIFLQNIQNDIANSTFNSYQPGFSLTTESAIYALIGICIGVSAYQLLLKILYLITRVLKKMWIKKHLVQS